jgi:putative redox protein
MTHCNSMQTSITWQAGLAFQTEIRGHQGLIDAKKEVGGQDLGPTPKELLLIAISGCAGMDVVSLMKKMRVNYDRFSVKASAELTKGDPPSIFSRVDLEFSVSGSDLDVAKIEKSVTLSMTKYCGVSAMIVKASPIFFTVLINGEKKAEGQAQFP